MRSNKHKLLFIFSILYQVIIVGTLDTFEKTHDFHAKHRKTTKSHRTLMNTLQLLRISVLIS